MGSSYDLKLMPDMGIRPTLGHVPGERPTARRAPPLAFEEGPLAWYVWPAEPPRPGASDGVVPLKGLPEGTADTLATLAVVVLGLGAVGARAFVELARLGAGLLLGVDPDSYGPESWQTQPSRRWADAGKSKARLQGEIAHAANPATTVITVKGFSQDLPLWAFRRASVLVAAGDNLDLMVSAGVLAAALGKTLVQGAVQGEQWVSFVRTYPLGNPEVGCPACALGAREWSMLRQRRGCDPNNARLQAIEPTRTLPPVCDLAASLVGGEVLKAILPTSPKAREAEELAYCMLTHRLWPTTYPRNLNCRCPHQRWHEIDVPASPSEVTLEMLLKQLPAAGPHNHAGPWLQIRGELPFASFTFCRRCDAQVPVRRFARLGQPVGRCACGEPLAVIPIGTRSVVPPDDVRHCLGLPLNELGIPPGGAVGIASDAEWSYFFVGKPPILDAAEPRPPIAPEPPQTLGTPRKRDQRSRLYEGPDDTTPFQAE